MKIGLFFGSFNPIHTGHLIIANYIANNTVDEVWFIVSPQNPLKQSTALLNAGHRLEFVKLAIETDDRFKVSDIEFQLPKPSYTIDTLLTLSKMYPHHEFYLILGSDNYSGLSEWKSSSQIINNFKLLVYERPGFPIRTKKNAYNNITFLNAPLLDISSTEIRELISQNKNIHYLVPEKVYKAIETNGYYK